MKVVSLFSGILGLDLGAELAGFEVVACVEWDKHCRRFISEARAGIPVFGDVREFTLESFRRECPGVQVDLVIGGPPCQPFSSAGKRMGADDPRDMWPPFVRVLDEFRPRRFLAENVEGLVHRSGAAYFGALVHRISLLGYRVGWGVVGADEACGSPMQGDRVFTTGFLASASSQRGEGVGLPVHERQSKQAVPDTDGRDPGLATPESGENDRSGKKRLHAEPASGEYELAAATRTGWQRPEGSVGQIGSPELAGDDRELETPRHRKRGRIGPSEPGDTPPGFGPSHNREACGPDEELAPAGHGPGRAEPRFQLHRAQWLREPSGRLFPPGRKGDDQGWLDVTDNGKRFWLWPALDKQEEAQLDIRRMADGLSVPVAECGLVEPEAEA